MKNKKLFVGLGSNVGDSKKILAQAVHRISKLCYPIVDCSPLYESPPQLVQDQPKFYNAVLELQVDNGDSPQTVYRRLKEVQDVHAAGKSAIRFGPRELDVDVIAMEGEACDTPQLTIPHPRAHQRDFVLRPLCDLKHGKDALLWDGKPAKLWFDQLDKDATKKLSRSIWSRRKDRPENHSVLMGILNVTPDSFSDGGKYVDPQAAVQHGLNLVNLGADIIDIGGQSTRPNATIISEQEELDRVIPIIEQLSKQKQDQQFMLSIDTRKPSVARAAILAGADIINDEIGEVDDEEQAMLELAGELATPLITMHARGDSRTMESMILQDSDIVPYVSNWMNQRGEMALRKHGVPTWNIMVDPGLGFAKTNQQSMAILQRLPEITRNSKFPIMIGASRKRFIRQQTTYDVDITTNVTTVAAIQGGALAVRVHNVEYAHDTLKMADAIYKC